MDFRIESVLISFILVAFLSVSIIEVLDFLIKKDYTSLIYNNQTYQSSIWCWGESVDTRKCRAVNICYQSNYRQWVFINGPDSVQSGLPADLFRPALISTSSLTGHNQFHFNYVTIDSQYFNQFSSKWETRFVRGKTFVFGRFKPDNLMHLLHDDILPLKWTLNGLDWQESVNLFLYDDWPAPKLIPENYDLYSKMFRLNEIFTKTMDPNKLICFQEAHIGLDRETIWYQYGFKIPQGPLTKTDLQKVNIEKITNQLRSMFKPKECTKSGQYGVFLSRTFNRLIINEDDLLKLLNKNIQPVIKVNVNDGLVNLIEEICCSNLLIGIHGSTLVLSLFLPPGSSIVEMFPFGINPDYYTPYKTLAQIRGLNYIKWVNQNLTNSIQHPEYPAPLGGIDDLPDEIKSSIKDLTQELEPHLCCYDANWLHRIYQDTIVDIGHFQQSIVPQLQINSHLEQQNQKVKSSFYPGPVSNIECSFEDSFGFRLTWQKPWNIEFLGNHQANNKLIYEILIDEGDRKGRSSLVSIESVLIPFDGKETFSLWVRCILNERKGPFVVSRCSK